MVIGVDLGGTNMRAGAVDDEGNLVELVSAEYEKGSDDIIFKTIIESINSLKTKYPGVTKAGVVFPGQWELERKLLLYPVNIKSMDEVPMVEIIGKGTGLEIFCDNDAVGAALAEGWVGQAKGASTYITITLGTGVGTGVIIHNKVFRGGQKLGCEWGHLQMSLEGIYECGCGNYGCIETFCSATALIKLANTRGIECRYAKEVTDLARQKNYPAIKIMEEYAEYIGVALYNYTIAINPEVIVLCGGLSRSSDLFLAQALEVMRNKLRSRNYMVPRMGVTCSTFPGHAGVLGAAYLCMKNGLIEV